MKAPTRPGPIDVADDGMRRRLEAIWHLEAARIIGRVARIVRDVGLAEEFAQDAMVAALEHWPHDGVPANPGAWLMTAAKRRALDHLRHRATVQDKADAVAREIAFQHEVATVEHEQRIDAALDDDIGDDLLRLIFTACHPVLSPEARCTLTLRVMGGLSTAEIARAYLKPEPTIAQRIVRAKRTLAAARVPCEVPRGAERVERLPQVLEVLYLIFNEGYAATTGPDWMRPALCAEAVRLGRVLASLLPNHGEVLGLLALMEIQASRLAARASPEGHPVLLPDQDRRLWDRLLIRRGLEALERAGNLPGPLGSYALQAAIAACHARAQTFADTDWHHITALYDALAEVAPSPIVQLNRAVAVSMTYGADAALDIVDALRNDPLLADYHLLPSVRGDLLMRLDRPAEARAEFERAAAQALNARERALLLARAADCATDRR